MARKFEVELDVVRGKEKFSLTVPPEDELKKREQQFRQFIEEMVARHPEYKVADNLREKGIFDEAEKIQRKILSEDATYYPALYGLGLIFRDKGDFELASKFLEDAEKHCNHELVSRQISLERASAEKELADSLRRTNPDLAFSHYAHAEELYMNNLRDGTLPTDGYVSAIVNYASLCFNLGRNSRAQKLYTFALEIIEQHRDIPKLAEIKPIVRRYLQDTNR